MYRHVHLSFLVLEYVTQYDVCLQLHFIMALEHFRTSSVVFVWSHLPPTACLKSAHLLIMDISPLGVN